MAALINFALANRLLVIGFLLAVTGYGLYCLAEIPIEAFPDLTNNQVSVITECPAMAAAEVEQMVSYPIETTLLGIPRNTGVRSVSKFGLSIVTVMFEDDVNTLVARQFINERLQEVRTRIPKGLEPGLGPLATVFGEVYQYTVETDRLSPVARKTLQEWQIKPQLRSVRGLNEVDSWGGETEQVEVELDPRALEQYSLTVKEVFDRITENNENFGGGYIEHAAEQYTVIGLGRVQQRENLGRIVLKTVAGTPVLLGNVAQIRTGGRQRQGAILRDGKGETVGGVAVMLKGENGRNVIERVKQRLGQIRVPEGVKLVPFYDQSEVIGRTIATVRQNLLEAGALVILVLLVFLGNVRAALLVALVIPLSMLIGFIGMRYFGISANLMSLGAVDFGMIVDGAVVMMESAVARLAMRDHEPVIDTLRHAAQDVARPIVFAVGIIIAVYLPLFFLEGLEGRLFRPMAVTVCSALLGSLVLALVAMPVLASFVLAGGVKPHSDEGWFERARRGYERVLDGVLHHRRWTLALGALLAVTAIGSLGFIGTEFMPRLEEGSILIQTKKLPGISLSESVALSTQVEKVVLTFPEVLGVVTKLGRSDLALDAMSISEGDVYILLKPVEQWTTAKTKEELIAKLDERLQAVPGVAYNFTQPMAMRLDETISGIKAEVAVKIFGEDAAVLEQLAQKALRALEQTPGAADTQMEVISGTAELRVEPDAGALARYGLNVADVREMVEAAVGGQHVSEMIEGQRRFPIVIKLPQEYRRTPEALRQIRMRAAAGERVMLGQVAKVSVARGPEMINRENGQRRIVVQANVRGRDLGGFVAEAQQKVAAAMPVPAGYFVDWGGQFENQARATRRLALVLPASLVMIFGLLYLTFHSFRQAMLILANVPFALVGGVAALWLREMNLNLSASIGFIALFGVAVLNGIVMVSQINRLLEESGGDVEHAIRAGAAARLRPVLMTALVAALGFLPMALSTSAGAEVQRPLATVVIGGLASSTVLTLFLLPAMYGWFRKRA
ncbi:MAG: efflux RND transporter permease subunit [Acidobacteriota bacterium]